MNAPARHTSSRPPSATSTAARQRREGNGSGAGRPSASTAEQALFRLQSTAGNRAATAAVQRARAAAPDVAGAPRQAPVLQEIAVDDDWGGQLLAELEATRRTAAAAEAAAGQAMAAAGERAGRTARAAVDEQARAADAWAGQVAADADDWARDVVAGADDWAAQATGARGRAAPTVPGGAGRQASADDEWTRQTLAAMRWAEEAPAAEQPSRRASTAAPAERTPAATRPATPQQETAPQQEHEHEQEQVQEHEQEQEQERERPQPAPGTAAGTQAKQSLRERAVQHMDRLKKLLDLGDNPAKGAQSPAASGLHHQAGTATSGGAADSGLTQDAAAAGTATGTVNLATEVLGVVVNALDAVKNLKSARQKQSGVAYHTAHRKGRTKRTDAAVGGVSATSHAGLIGREAARAQQAAHAASAAQTGDAAAAAARHAQTVVTSTEAAGGLSAVSGAVKAGRAGYKVTHAVRKRREITKVENRFEAELTRLEQAVRRAEEESGNAEAARAAYERAAQDAGELKQAQKYAKKKQTVKGVKETLGGVGEGAKSAGGAVIVAIAAGGLASTPAGWATAAAGAGLILLVAGYKGGRAATKRYQEARHPDRYTPEGDAEQPKSWGEALRHALSFWKKVSKHERTLMAHRIYRMAAGPGVPGSDAVADEVRASARELLVALKAGPTDHRVNDEEWRAGLNDPEQKSAWIKEIAEQLASG